MKLVPRTVRDAGQPNPNVVVAQQTRTSTEQVGVQPAQTVNPAQAREALAEARLPPKAGAALGGTVRQKGSSGGAARAGGGGFSALLNAAKDRVGAAVMAAVMGVNIVLAGCSPASIEPVRGQSVQAAQMAAKSQGDLDSAVGNLNATGETLAKGKLSAADKAEMERLAQKMETMAQEKGKERQAAQERLVKAESGKNALQKLASSDVRVAAGEVKQATVAQVRSEALGSGARLGSWLDRSSPDPRVAAERIKQAWDAIPGGTAVGEGREGALRALLFVTQDVGKTAGRVSFAASQVSHAVRTFESELPTFGKGGLKTLHKAGAQEAERESDLATRFSNLHQQGAAQVRRGVTDLLTLENKDFAVRNARFGVVDGSYREVVEGVSKATAASQAADRAIAAIKKERSVENARPWTQYEDVKDEKGNVTGQQETYQYRSWESDMDSATSARRSAVSAAETAVSNLNADLASVKAAIIGVGNVQVPSLNATSGFGRFNPADVLRAVNTLRDSMLLTQGKIEAEHGPLKAYVDSTIAARIQLIQAAPAAPPASPPEHAGS